MATILVVDDSDRYIELCRTCLPEHVFRGPAHDLAGAKAELRRGGIDLVLLDIHFDLPVERLIGVPEGASAAEVARAQRHQGLLILRELRALYPELPVILFTSREDVPLEWQAPVDEDFTFFLDDEYVDMRAVQGLIHALVGPDRPPPATGPIYWGDGLVMRKIERRLQVLARGRLPVMLLGPTGTGKSLIARHFVHRHSRRKGSFVVVDLSTVPTALMAAHLFGSVRGAYTGAVADRRGAFEAANGGTLFLDEIGNLPLEAQKMLLTVLQEGSVRRVGDLRERPVDVKLVVATNEDLAARVREGSFRADLYMRLNPATAIHLPPLVERKLDLADLLEFCLHRALARPYLQELVEEYRQAVGLERGTVRFVVGSAVPPPARGTLVIRFSERALGLLRGYRWPGNLREFAMVAENAVLFALAEIVGAPPGQRADVVTVHPKLIRDLLGAGLERAEALQEGVPVTVRLRPRATLNKVSVDCERQYFVDLYMRTGGDFAAMAEHLLGDRAHARKVRLRFNQIGLKVKDFKGKLP